jgi:hypothetical protein
MPIVRLLSKLVQARDHQSQPQPAWHHRRGGRHARTRSSDDWKITAYDYADRGVFAILSANRNR